VKPGQLLCGCGSAYWPKQKWAHEGHVFSPEVSRVTSDASTKGEVKKPAPRAKAAVVDTVVDVANGRTRDRHKKTAARRLYLRAAQKRSRARRAARQVSA
jgi:hypothetical protein